MKYLRGNKSLLHLALLMGLGIGVWGCSRGNREGSRQEREEAQVPFPVGLQGTGTQETPAPSSDSLETSPVPSSFGTLPAIGVVQDLGALGGESSVACGINEAGQVVGYSTMAEDNQKAHAFLWEAGQGMQDLGTLGGAESSAQSVNNAGQVVGCSDTAERERHAFLWEAGQGMQDLGSLRIPYALSINKIGQVVGFSRTAKMETHAFLWEAQPIPRQLERVLS